jgi:hypothetical protein
MYIDAQARPSFAQSLAAAAGTYVSTDSLDLLSAIDNPGRSGMPLRAYAVVTTAGAGGTSCQAQLISSVNSNLSSPTVLASGPVVALANLTAGAKLMDQMLPDITDRYIGFQYVTVGTFTTLNVTAAIVGGTDRNSTVIPMNLG